MPGWDVKIRPAQEEDKKKGGDSSTTWKWGLIAGLLAGVGWTATMFTIISLFEQRSLRYLLINCGYITVYFGVIGFVLGIWR